MTLREWLPSDAYNGMSTRERKRVTPLLDQVVTQEYGDRVCGWRPDRPVLAWPGKHRNVMNWCVLSGGLAVGFNENPSTGWSFPVIRVA